jgi:uncharacterized membrane protein
MSSERPRIPIKKAATDRGIDAVSMLLLLLIWIYVVVSYISLPEQIPVHYNLEGVADRYGNKITVFILPAIISAVWAGLGILNRYPHIFNYPVKITEANAGQQYRAATRLIRVMKLVIVCFCLFITWKVINAASTLEWWLLPAMFVLLLAPVMFYLYHSMKEGKNTRP